MNDRSASGIFVLDGGPAGAPIALRREPVVAFVGPAPRGPADMPVAIRSLREFHQRFGCADTPSRLERCLAGFFAAGAERAIVVRISDPARRAQLKLPGAAGGLRLVARCPGEREYLRAAVDYAAVSGAGRFNLVVQRLASPTGALVAEQESFRDVSIEPAADDYVGDALLDSRLVNLAAPPTGLPDATPLAPSGSAQWISATSPASELPGDYELIGSATDSTGLHALEQLPRLDLLCLLPPVAGASIGPLAMFAAERYCRRRHALLLVDPPPGWESVHDVVADQGIHAFDSANVMTYFPRPQSGSLLGVIAGALAAGDQAHGPWRWPADGKLRLHTTARLAPRLSSRDAQVLARFGVNAVRRDHRSQARLEGLVTRGRRLGLAPESAQLVPRRTALFILGGLTRGSRWTAFRPDDDYTRAELRQQLLRFLGRLHRAGALQGGRAQEAWYLHGPDRIDGGLQLELGLALLRAGTFQTWRITQRGGDCEVRELGWQPGLALAG